MHRLFVIWLALSLAGGCDDHGAGRLARIQAEVCRCKTARCADAAMKQIPAHAIASTPRTQEIARQMLDCVAKLYRAGPPGDAGADARD